MLKRSLGIFVESLFTSFSMIVDVNYVILPVISLVVMLISTFALRQPSIAQNETWQNLTRLDYSLQASDWTLQPDIGGEGVILKPNIGGVVLEFNIEDIWAGESFSHEVANAKSGSGFKLTELDNNTFVSGHPTVKIVGESPNLGKTMELLSQFGGKIYTINYYGSPEAYNSFLPTVQQMIDSFNVTETATGNQTDSNMTNR